MLHTQREYNIFKDNFFIRHELKQIDTTPMINNEYQKTYTATDGAMWTENMRPVTETATVKIHNIEVPVKVELQQIEYCDTDGTSGYYFERY